jgi:ATP-dependent Lon protease
MPKRKDVPPPPLDETLLVRKTTAGRRTAAIIAEDNARQFVEAVKIDIDLDDVEYFKKQYTTKQQTVMLSLVEDLNRLSVMHKSHLMRLLESRAPPKVMALVYKKLQYCCNEDNANAHKTLEWVDAFLRLPFDRFHQLPPLDSVEQKREFIQQSRCALDRCTYGMSKAKSMILELIAKWVVNPASVGTAIGLHGPMGIGKTTLIKHGVSQLMNNRPFAFVSLGGATDGCCLEGHSFTYDGSMYGKIVDHLIQTQCNNPIFFFDELDKVSETQKGNEIINILIHLTDTTQNSSFRDKYFSEFEFDLSKCLFIFSYNDESKINPILKDRMYSIQLDGYTMADKKVIARDYLLPELMRDHHFSSEDNVWNDQLLEHIIQHKTAEEKGVRNLKRSLETILRKLNMQRFMPDPNVHFPLFLSMQLVDNLLPETPTPPAYSMMYA